MVYNGGMDTSKTPTQTQAPPPKKIPGANGRGTLTPYDSTRAREAAHKRWEKYRRDAADAVAKEAGSIMPGSSTPGAAWGILNARLYQQIMDSDKPRGGDVEILGRNIGALPRLTDAGTAQPQSVTNVLAISDTAARALADALARIQTQTIDAHIETEEE